MPRLISIGNSFSQDAQRYLHELTRLTGEPFSTVNLYIGGCSLERHVNNLHSGESVYDYEYNGEGTGLKVSLQDAFGHTSYPIVTFQQVSQCAIDYQTFQPYLSELVAYVREKQPNAKLYFHQTWAYAKGSERLHKELGYSYAWEMTRDVRNASRKAAQDEGMLVIPSGDAMLNALMAGVKAPMHRDGFHASLNYGRYLLALTWYMTLTGKNVPAGVVPKFADGSEADPETIALLQKAAYDAVTGAGYSLENV